jgi:hypothetical protein
MPQSRPIQLAYIVTILMGFASSSFAEIRGQVLEKGTRKPLNDVNVFVLPQKWKATTDQTGRFQFNESPTEEGELIINISGYKKFTKKIDPTMIQGTQTNDLKIYVEKESYQYLETTVTAAREKKESQKTLKQEEFLTMPGSGGDPVKAVQNLPGVNRSSGGDSRVIIQGAEPEDTKYNIGGHEVPLIFHFGGLTSIVTPEAIESVDYFSAGHGAEWGRALGGHVGLNVRNPKTDRHHAFAFMDTFNSGGLAEGPIDENSSYLVTGRYSYVGEVLKSVMKDNEDFDLSVAPSFYDLSGLYQRKLSDADEVRLFTILSQDKLEFVLNKPVGNDPKLRGRFFQQTRFNRIIPQWKRQIDSTTALKITSAYGNNDILADIGTNYFHLLNRAFTNRAEYSMALQPQWKSSFGVDTLDNWYNVELRIPTNYAEGGVSNPLSSGEVKETKVKGHDNLLGVYWTNEYKTSDASPWTYLPQVRFDRFSPTNEILTQPRFSLRYQVDQSLLLRFGTGLYYQLPQPQEYDNYYGNPDIKSSRAQHYILSFEKDFRQGSTEGYQWTSGLFYKNLDSLVIPSRRLVTRNSVQNFENFSNEGTGTIKGFETQVKFKGDTYLSWIASYTYVQSRRKQPGQSELPSQYDQTHSVNLLASYILNDWQLGSRLRFVSGNPYTPIIGSTFDADNDVYLPQRGEIYSERNPNFFQWDIRVDRKWIYDTWILSAYLDIQNLTNSQNQESITYSYDYSEKKPITGLPTLPSIGVKGEF